MADKQLWEVTPVATDVKNDDGVIIGGQTAGTRYAPLTLIASFVHNLWAAFINALTAKTSFASGDKIPVVNGSTATAMSKDKLLELTAQNTLAGNVAQEFVPNETNAVAGMLYVYGGKLYVAKEDYNGTWVASKFSKVTLSNALLIDIIKASADNNETTYTKTTNHYINADGSLTYSSSWTAFYYEGDDFKLVWASLYSSLLNPCIAFYNSTTIGSSSFISSFDAKQTGKSELFGSVPSGTKCIVIASRTGTATDHKFAVCEDLAKLKTSILNITSDVDYLKKSSDIEEADSVDAKYFNGSNFMNSPAWKRYIFDNTGNRYNKITATAASNTPTFGEVVFLDEGNNVLSFETYGSSGIAVEKTLTIPNGCKYICVCNRTENLASPTVSLYSADIDSALKRVDAKITDVNTSVTQLNSYVVDALKNQSVSATIDSAFSVDHYYYNGSGFSQSLSWNRYIFENKGYKTIYAKAASNTPTFGEVVFLDEGNNVLSFEPYGSSGVSVEKTLIIPNGCKYICVCNRTATFANPDVALLVENFVPVFDKIGLLPEGVSGVMKFKNIAGSPPYNIKVGDISKVSSHFKMAMVKDGVLKYWLNQTNINKDENGLFDSILDGTDGDLLIVNDTPVYMLSGENGVFGYRLFSLEPFTFEGMVAQKIEYRGEAPSLCFVDNINDSNMADHEANLGSGKTHFVRNSNNVAYHSAMTDLVGKYVPSELGGVISYSYDSSKSLFDSGAFLPSVWLNQNTAENAATNKNVGDAVYTNMDLLSIDIVIALAQAECGTNFINDASLFGNGFSGASQSGHAITEALFTNGTDAINGVRFKDNSNNWVYKRLIDTPFNNDMWLFQMLTDWMTPWEIAEQHLALSYAKENSIAANTWFVYNDNEYKYTNVGTLKGLSDGVMTANVFKKFRTKLGNVTYEGNSVQGNDIEFVILSSIYHGWVLDVCPHRWVTGLNIVADDSNNYSIFATKNYQKYIMNQDYSEIADTELFDFEKQYDFIATITNSSNSFLFPKYTSKKSVYGMIEDGATDNFVYECGLIETDKKKANADKKIVLGVKLGYGTFSDRCSRNFLYVQHPRTYFVAKAGYSSFVCQNVKV